jgi:hypothetical protein
VGYFWHYPEHLPVFDLYYKISRLPWILPGFIAHRFFDEVTASLLLHWVTLSTGGVALYLLMRDTLKDRLVAAALSVAWVSSTRGHGLGGWNYHMMAATAYFVLGNWLLVRSAIRRSRASALLAGATMACAVHTHLAYAFFIPLAIVLYFVALPDRPDWKTASIDGGFAAAGGLVLTALLVAINVGTGGSWRFFLLQVEHTVTLTQPGNNTWWRDASVWLPNATYMVLPVASLCAAAVALLRRNAESWRFSVAFVATGWIALAFYAYWQIVKHQTILDYDYLAYSLYCYGFPALGVVVLHARTRAQTPSNDKDTGDVVTLLAVVAIVLAPLLTHGAFWISNKLHNLSYRHVPILAEVLPPFVVGLVGLMVATRLSRKAAVVTAMFVFSCINVWVAYGQTQYGINTPGIRRDLLHMFREADRFTTALDPSLDRIKYWVPSEIVDTVQGRIDLLHVFNSFVSTREWFDHRLGFKSPGPPLDAITNDDLQNVTCVGLLSSITTHDAVRTKAIARFETLGRPVTEVGARSFGDQRLGFHLTVLRIGAEGRDQSHLVGSRHSC